MRASQLAALIAGVIAASATLAQNAGNPVPTPPEVKEHRRTSNPSDYQRESVYKRKYETEQERKTALEKELADLRANVAKPPAPVNAPAGESQTQRASGTSPARSPEPASWAAEMGLDAIPLKLDTQDLLPPPAGKAGKRGVKKAVISKPAAEGTQDAESGGEAQVFGVSAATMELVARGPETAVPLGSYVKARVLTGVEANSQDAYPILLQLDYAFTGPNHTRIDLSHCFVVAKALANLSTERVMGETQQISCVRQDNEIVTRPAKGYIAGEDSTFGMTGQLISHQGRVLVAAVLASLAKSAGEAVASAQTTTEIASGGVGAVQAATNVTGNKAVYVAGKAITEPAGMIAQWYLDFAKQLVPAIAVGSGRDVWIVLLDTVKVPELGEDGRWE